MLPSISMTSAAIGLATAGALTPHMQAPAEISLGEHFVAHPFSPAVQFPLSGPTLFSTGSRATSHSLPRGREDGLGLQMGSRAAFLEQIQPLKKLHDGWNGPGSLRPASQIISWLEQNKPLLAYADVDVHPVPVSDGSISLHWTRGEREFTAELRPDFVMYLFMDDTRTDEFVEKILPLDAGALLSFIRSGKAA